MAVLLSCATPSLDILPLSIYLPSIWQGPAEHQRKHICTYEILKFMIMRCLYQNQNQVENDHWNQDGSSSNFPHIFEIKILNKNKFSSQHLQGRVGQNSVLSWKLLRAGAKIFGNRFFNQKPARHCVSVRGFLYFYNFSQFLYIFLI